ncbi:hypothetical protein GDO78_017433 [Eleutherodactylus coqui]|uniref:Uncharacterized protein n=1 Tax=Eleutherodactylus coqui TaxID=57060 RepID=A0A8J6BLG8_ELECQ|nr:hypothetical protein GDO78_017433 [Eleutherodactylus coqui]
MVIFRMNTSIGNVRERDSRAGLLAPVCYNEVTYGLRLQSCPYNRDGWDTRRGTKGAERACRKVSFLVEASLVESGLVEAVCTPEITHGKSGPHESEHPSKCFRIKHTWA